MKRGLRVDRTLYSRDSKDMERSENEMYKEGETGGKLSESEEAAEREGVEEKKGKRERFRLCYVGKGIVGSKTTLLGQ